MAETANTPQRDAEPAASADQARTDDGRSAEASYGQLLAYLLRTSQQHLVQMSAMADMKANILITTGAIILTVAIARFDDPQLQAALSVVSVFSLISLVLAVLAVLPTATPPRSKSAFEEDGNVLFFGHFTAMPEDEFVDRMGRVIETDQTIVQAQLRDIYQSGSYLQRQKFRYLRYAYISFLLGLVFGGVTQAVVTFGDLAGSS